MVGSLVVVAVAVVVGVGGAVDADVAGGVAAAVVVGLGGAADAVVVGGVAAAVVVVGGAAAAVVVDAGAAAAAAAALAQSFLNSAVPVIKANSSSLAHVVLVPRALAANLRGYNWCSCHSLGRSDTQVHTSKTKLDLMPGYPNRMKSV